MHYRQPLMMIVRDGCSLGRGEFEMLFLLFLFIVPSAVGIYFLLKPPFESEAEMDIKSIANVVTHLKGYEEISNGSTTNSNTLMRKQTVNE